MVPLGMDHAGSAALDFTWSRIAPGGFLAAWKVWDGSEVVGRIQAPGRGILVSGKGVCGIGALSVANFQVGWEWGEWVLRNNLNFRARLCAIPKQNQIHR